ncbi:hypothetical protein HYV81_04090 [Candidatus Woesearchaeota archaeon]|nr:hypothetical protein [Candidatus Woesearchaeota archaeon]
MEERTRQRDLENAVILAGRPSFRSAVERHLNPKNYFVLEDSGEHIADKLGQTDINPVIITDDVKHIENARIEANLSQTKVVLVTDSVPDAVQAMRKCRIDSFSNGTDLDELVTRLFEAKSRLKVGEVPSILFAANVGNRTMFQIQGQMSEVYQQRMGLTADQVSPTELSVADTFEGVRRLLRTRQIGVLVLESRLPQKPGENPEDVMPYIDELKRLYPLLKIAVFADSTWDPALAAGEYGQKVHLITSSEDLFDGIKRQYETRIQAIRYILEKGNANLIFMAGAQGTGKTTLIDRIKLSIPTVDKIIRYTTREPGPFEIQGDDHLFVDEAKFDQIIAEGRMGPYFTHRTERRVYRVGIESGLVERRIKEGHDGILTIGNPKSLEIFKGYYESKGIPIKSVLMVAAAEQLVRAAETREGRGLSLEEADRQLADFLKYPYDLYLFNPIEHHRKVPDEITGRDAQVLDNNVMHMIRYILWGLKNIYPYQTLGRVTIR